MDPILGEKRRTQPSHCNYCGQLNDAYSEVGGNTAKPKLGDVVICLGCSGLNIYGEGGLLRKPTPAETKAANSDFKLQLVRYAVFQVALERAKLK